MARDEMDKTMAKETERERLARIVERAVQAQFDRIVEAELAREMREAATDRQGGRSEDPGCAALRAQARAN